MIDSIGKKTNVGVFNAQGGFVSFVSGVGNCSYLLEYETQISNFHLYYPRLVYSSI